MGVKAFVKWKRGFFLSLIMVVTVTLLKFLAGRIGVLKAYVDNVVPISFDMPSFSVPTKVLIYGVVFTLGALPLVIGYAMEYLQGKVR